VLTLTGHATPPQPVSPPALLASLPPSVAEPVLPTPALVPPTPALVPPSPPLEIDIGLVQTLWGTKIQMAEQGALPRPGALTQWETLVTNTTKGLGLDVMTWQTSIWQLASVTRPCFIEVFPEPTATRSELWVLARGVPQG